MILDDTIPVWMTEDPTYEEISYKNVDDDDFTYGPFDARKFGRKSTYILRWLAKYQADGIWETAVEGREDEMAEKIIDQIETHSHTRVAVIFGRSHVIGLEKMFEKQLS